MEELGAGFVLATHDLEIRGAGELLGEQQSGQVTEIGLSLYLDMLERAVRALKAGREPLLDQPLAAATEVELRLPAFLPEAYVGDVHVRLSLYKRIAAAESEAALADLAADIQDRFGAARPAPSQEPAAPSAPPSGTVYNVELIVFRATAASSAAENWSAEAGERTLAGDESTSDSAQVGRFVAQLPASAWQLTELENRLRADGNYVPLAHAAWSQTASSWGTRAGFPVRRLGLNVPGLSGTVFLERGQFLHLGLSLTYAMPSPPEGLGAAPDTPFTLNQRRRAT